MAHGSSSNRYQLIPLQAFPSLPKFTARKKHHSIPRWLYITALLVPVVVIGWILYKLAIVTNAFRTYEANPPVFAEPFRGKGIDAEPRAPEFPPWVVTDWHSVEATAWNVRKELNNRFHEMGLPVSLSRSSCDGANDEEAVGSRATETAEGVSRLTATPGEVTSCAGRLASSQC